MEIKSILQGEDAEYFELAYNKALKNHDDVTSTIIAWGTLRLKMQRDSEEAFAKSIQVHTLGMNAEETNIAINSETEEIIMDAVLADTSKNTDGKYFTEEELNDLSNQINTFGSTVPDIDHEKLMSLVHKYGRDHEAIMHELKNEKGVMKNIKASVEKGRLWIRASLDKRFKNHLDKFKALSIEAFADVDNMGRFSNPKYLGFTFTNNPKLKNARIAI